MMLEPVLGIQKSPDITSGQKFENNNKPLFKERLGCFLVEIMKNYLLWH